ncbi:MAG: LysR family transcriptional regulator [Pseudomonadota bacterium]
MEFRQLRTFQTVATLLSFNRAAGVLNYAQSTISAQIGALEEELGVKVFDRLGKRVVLTEAGERLFEYSRKMFDMEAETLAGVKGGMQSQGSLTIRVPQSIGNAYFPEILAEHRRRFPRVGFNFHTCAFHSLEHELQTGVTDLAFLLAESINSACLVAEPLKFERLLMVADAGHPLTEKSKVLIRDLAGEAIFFAKADCGYRMVFEQMLTEADVTPQTMLEFNNIEMMKACLARSGGVSLIPEIMVRGEIDRGELSVLQWEDPHMETAVLMIRHKEKWLSPSLRAFMEIARNVIGDDTTEVKP